MADLLPVSKAAQTLLYPWTFRAAGEEYLSLLGSGSIIEKNILVRTRQKDSFAFELETSTPRLLSLRFRRLLIFEAQQRSVWPEAKLSHSS